MREAMVEAVKAHAKGHIEKHRMNVINILENAVGVAEHPDIMESIEKELKIIAEYDDQLQMINKYFE